MNGIAIGRPSSKNPGAGIKANPDNPVMTRRNVFAFTSRVETRLAAYASLAVAAVSVPTDSKAAIVYSGPVNITIPSTVDGIYLNIVAGTIGTSSASVPGWDINPWGAADLRFFTPTPNPGGGGEMIGSGATYYNLTLDTVIGPGSSFANAGITTINPGTPWNFDSQSNYVGFRFMNESTGMINYGWAQIALSGTASSQRSIIGYAYENTGAAIGFPVPEPAAAVFLGLFAAGAAGLGAWRKRKRAVSPPGNLRGN